MAAAKKKKRFFNVELPLINKTTQLQAMEIKELGNRFIKYDLTRMLKGKSTLITLKTKLEDENVTTSPFGLMSTDRLTSLVEEILIGIPPIKNHFFFSLEKAWMVLM